MNKPILYHQLCAIARTILEADYTISDADWKDAIKVYLAKNGWTLADHALLPRVLNAVEHAVQRKRGSRDVHREGSVHDAITAIRDRNT